MIWVIAVTKSVPHTDMVRKREVQVAALKSYMCFWLSFYIAQEKKKTHTPHYIHML